MKLNWRSRDSDVVKYFIVRGMFQDLDGFANDEPVEVPQPVFRPLPINKELDQLRGHLLHLEKKVIELDKKKQEDDAPF